MSSHADYRTAGPAATMGDLVVLGIETSCDETAAAVVRLDAAGAATVLSSIVHSQTVDHAPYGGVVPEIAARSHVEIIAPTVQRALAEAGVGWDGLTGVAATAGPGLVGGVMVGLSFGKAAALARGLPLIAVNHLEGHAVSARLGAEVPYPFLLLLVSGGHCQLLEVRGVGEVARLGATIDDAAGEAFDKIAKALGLGYPGGPALERLAATGDGSRFALPRARVGEKDCDFSFSGLKTAAFRQAQACETDQDRADLADARSERAMQAWPHDSRLFVVAGGVAANRTVRAWLEEAAARHGFCFVAPPLAYCTDNAAMIALAGAERLARGERSDIDAVARPRWPLDEAAALARPSSGAGRKGAKA